MPVPLGVLGRKNANAVYSEVPDNVYDAADPAHAPVLKSKSPPVPTVAASPAKRATPMASAPPTDPNAEPLYESLADTDLLTGFNNPHPSLLPGTPSVASQPSSPPKLQAHTPNGFLGFAANTPPKISSPVMLPISPVAPPLPPARQPNKGGGTASPLPIGKLGPPAAASTVVAVHPLPRVISEEVASSKAATPPVADRQYEELDQGSLMNLAAGLSVLAASSSDMPSAAPTSGTASRDSGSLSASPPGTSAALLSQPTSRRQLFAPTNSSPASAGAAVGGTTSRSAPASPQRAPNSPKLKGRGRGSASMRGRGNSAGAGAGAGAAATSSASAAAAAATATTTTATAAKAAASGNASGGRSPSIRARGRGRGRGRNIGAGRNRSAAPKSHLQTSFTRKPKLHTPAAKEEVQEEGGATSGGETEYVLVDEPEIDSRVRRHSEVNRTRDAERLAQIVATLKPFSRSPIGITFTGRRLGEGYFGRVEEARLRGDDGVEQLVAIKIAKDDVPEGPFELYKEAQIMVEASNPPHENVLKITGVVFSPMTPWLIMEYCGMGDLLTLLRQHRPGKGASSTLSEAELIGFGRQIASGMKHLAAKGIVHRDLACRNVLITNQLVCKISDYGLARRTDTGLYMRSSSGRVAFKWLALETLLVGESSTKSDVWSFGVALWEILTLGEIPYPTIPNEHLLPFLRSGHRLPCPVGCNRSLYTLMSSCWKEEPADRPTFAEMLAQLNALFDELKQHKHVPKDKHRLMKMFGRRSSSGHKELRLEPDVHGAILQAVKRGDLDIDEAAEIVQMYASGRLSQAKDEKLPKAEEGAAVLIDRFRQVKAPASRRESFV